jgi:hypothetical protein
MWLWTLFGFCQRYGKNKQAQNTWAQNKLIWIIIAGSRRVA